MSLAGLKSPGLTLIKLNKLNMPDNRISTGERIPYRTVRAASFTNVEESPGVNPQTCAFKVGRKEALAKTKCHHERAAPAEKDEVGNELRYASAWLSYIEAMIVVFQSLGFTDNKPDCFHTGKLKNSNTGNP